MDLGGGLESRDEVGSTRSRAVDQGILGTYGKSLLARPSKKF
jgi:hypothetical protein